MVDSFARIIKSLESLLGDVLGALIQVSCLADHKVTAQKAMLDVKDALQIPVSQVDVEAVAGFLDEQKSILKVCEADLKDGKRRVSSSKGPKKRAKVNEDDDAHDDSGSESLEGEGEDLDV